MADSSSSSLSTADSVESSQRSLEQVVVGFFFTLLENSFNVSQARAMENYIEESLMLQYNKR